MVLFISQRTGISPSQRKQNAALPGPLGLESDFVTGTFNHLLSLYDLFNWSSALDSTLNFPYCSRNTHLTLSLTFSRKGAKTSVKGPAPSEHWGAYNVCALH